MKRLLRWSKRLVLSVLAILVLATATVYLISWFTLSGNRGIEVAQMSVPDLPTGPEAIEEGERLATIHGCRGCHEEDLSGGVFFGGDNPLMGRVVATNLSAALEDYSDAELVRAIRYGIGRTDRPLIAMPSAMFHPLSDEDLGLIMAYLRSVEPVENELPSTGLGPAARAMLLMGPFELDVDVVLDGRVPEVTPDPEQPKEWGRYLASTNCAECHEHDLLGGGSIPALTIVAGYDREQFGHLMRTGEPIGDRELDLMAAVARGRFAHFTEEEVDALYAYLSTFGSELDETSQE